MKPPRKPPVRLPERPRKEPARLPREVRPIADRLARSAPGVHLGPRAPCGCQPWFKDDPTNLQVAPCKAGEACPNLTLMRRVHERVAREALARRAADAINQRVRQLRGDPRG